MTVDACAKVNLTLEVFGRRPDGYHALRSVVAPISLCDTLELEATDDGALESDTGYEDDLCLRAARVLRPGHGVRIRVTKRIPAGGGLGGGSADAAAVLRALNELWRLGKTPEELATIGAAVGSDVPALVLAQHYRCPVLMEGRGEKVTLIGATAPLRLVLVNPGVHTSTKDVYAACVPRMSGGASATDEMIAALRSGNLGAIAAALRNDLQAPAVRLHPEIGAVLDAFRKSGAAGVQMSGSGSTVFGLVADAVQADRLTLDFACGRCRSWSAAGAWSILGGRDSRKA